MSDDGRTDGGGGGNQISLFVRYLGTGCRSQRWVIAQGWILPSASDELLGQVRARTAGQCGFAVALLPYPRAVHTASFYCYVVDNDSNPHITLATAWQT
jgi:hypothetical protein